ncbi:hypothetical protein O3M35_010505 [Rhynocoris fuscipes]|uniref:UDP-glucuronosyltransferase n=1 Tax=Rhynocoris fuscipes TaxID=488301 RepID=A0AAW1D1X9_9HEMI
MILKYIWTVILIYVLFCSNLCNSAKILGIFGHTGKSHHLVFQPVLKELAKRGHQLTVFSYFEHDTTTTNYTGILFPEKFNTTSFLSMDYFDKSSIPFSGIIQLYSLTEVYENSVSFDKLQSLVNEKYDLVITEMFNSDVFFGLFYKIGAPIVGFSSCDIFPWQNDAFGNNNNPSYNPHVLHGLSVHMDLKERLLNTFHLLVNNFVYYYKFLPEAQNLAEKYFGKIPHVNDIVKNTSILLVNTHFSIFGAKPVVPSIVEVAGVHISPVKPLSKNLEETIGKFDETIYFSMGSVLDSGSMSKEKHKIFVNVFSKLKQLVLWKSSQIIPNKPNNIFLSDWYSQRDVLAHPKTVLFISHCGLLGTLEAIQAGVPILCFPMFGDQHHNAKAIATKEISLTLNYAEVTEESLSKAINTLLYDSKYRENAKSVSNAFNDRPLSPMDTAIYWIEYVIRHKGGPHIRSSIYHLTWYQYYNLDVIIIYLAILYLLYKFSKFIFVKLFKLTLSSKKIKTN